MIIFVGLGIFILSVVMMAWLSEISIQKNMKIVAEQACPQCANKFGYEIIEKARLDSPRPINDKKEEGTLLGRTLSVWYFECPNCKKKFSLSPQDWLVRDRQ